MQNQRRGAPNGPRPAEMKVTNGTRSRDINRERMIYYLTSLVGHKVTAICRDNVTYEGIFHSCSLNGDCAVTLKSAKLKSSKGNASSEIIKMLVIPGKDYLQISAVDVPSPRGVQPRSGLSVFATDSEIAVHRRPMDGVKRELVAWTALDGECTLEESGDLDDLPIVGRWDQFAANQRMYQVQSTFDEELYTTKLDQSSIPREKREAAERIAREIEGGRMNAEVENCLNGDDDEELAFSAVSGTGAYLLKDQSRAGVSTVGAGKGRATRIERELALSAAVRSVPAFSKDALLSESGSPNQSCPTATEMKRINALNLEPALPKLDDKTRNDWIKLRQSQRSTSKAAISQALKSDFQQSLELFKRRDGVKAATAAGSKKTGAALENAGREDAKESSSRESKAGADVLITTESTRSSKSALNPGAKEFSFNPSAPMFTPSNPASASQTKDTLPGQRQPTQVEVGHTGSATSSRAQVVPGHGRGPLFVPKRNFAMINRPIGDFLEGMLKTITGERTEACSSAWPGAAGPRYQEVLGQPNGVPMSPMAFMAAPCSGGGLNPPDAGQGHNVMQPPHTFNHQHADMQQQQAGGMMQGMQQQVMPQPGVQAGVQQGMQQGMPQQGMHLAGMGMNTNTHSQGAMGAMPKFGGAPMVPVVMRVGQFGPQGVPFQQGDLMSRSAEGLQQGHMMPQGQVMSAGPMVAQAHMMQPADFSMSRGGGQMSGQGLGSRAMRGHGG